MVERIKKFFYNFKAKTMQIGTIQIQDDVAKLADFICQFLDVMLQTFTMNHNNNSMFSSPYPQRSSATGLSY